MASLGIASPNRTLDCTARSCAGGRRRGERARRRGSSSGRIGTVNLHFPVFELPAEAQALRREVRAFIAAENRAGLWQRGGDFATHYDPAFSRRLGARGWLGMTWPRRYGGQERSMLERLVLSEELIAANAPIAAHWIADRQSGPLLLRYGSEAQRREFLPRIARGEIFFSIGMSEPDSGSDLASVRTRAVQVDGGWRIDGRKLWTSFAHLNHYAIVLARTGAAGESRHEGLSQFIVDLKAGDLEVRPIVNMAGQREFNEVVFTGSFVPDARLVGEPGNGWRQVTSELAYERSGPERYLSFIRLAEAALQCAGANPSPRLREALGRTSAKLIALRSMSIAVAALLQQGAMPNLEASLIKDLGTAFEREQIGVYRALRSELAPASAEYLSALAETTIYAPSWTLRGGTREILRGIVARGLGMR
ncbi:MAG: acyl-CoA dehydrogenase [Betaproteobacteria bacterium]|nr:MAG: acyl-CoA dehydrogenase [Betaproteobacteria bacterium]